VGLERIRIVLVRPQHPGNVGAAARAMKNMGLQHLVLVGPRPLDLDGAAVMAVHARDVLERHRRVDTLADAIGECGLVIGASGRAGDEHADCAPPRTLVPAILAASAANDVALVFGPEDHGLTKEELGHCHRVLTIPSTAAYPSLNLAQAVLICGYELRLAVDAGADGGDEQRCQRILAPAALGEQMFAALERALRAIGFVHRDNGVHMMRAFRRLFGRAALDEYETRVVLGLARQIEWAAGHASGETLNSRSDTGS
jgi:TrmH family RNA methyltransferase